jgi:hypothetical protein
VRDGMSRVRCERGLVIAEAAFAIPVLAVVALAAVTVMSIAMTSVVLQGLAHTAARDIARGTAFHSVEAAVHASQPQATVAVTPTPHGVAVTVHRDVQIAGGLLAGLAVPLQRRVVVPWEVGIAETGAETADAS